jgi:hypothetical protein
MLRKGSRSRMYNPPKLSNDSPIAGHMRRTLLLSWMTGFIIGAVFYSFWHLHNSGGIGPSDLGSIMLLQGITLILWPTSLALVSVSGQHLGATVVIVLISLSLNGFIYMGCGYVLTKIFRRPKHQGNLPNPPAV